MPAAHGDDVARHSKLMHHLHQVIDRDVIGTGDVGNRHQPVRLQRQVDQRPQRVVGEAGETHAASLGRRRQPRPVAKPFSNSCTTAWNMASVRRPVFVFSRDT
jgi:hypothetical protein